MGGDWEHILLFHEEVTRVLRKVSKIGHLMLKIFWHFGIKYKVAIFFIKKIPKKIWVPYV
jgi:hypothetical protein